uniref:Putative secreted salivary protein n=1 Tax=Ixodes scapularis TaxID=6945 RepID=Q4PMN1_IXOSC|nr:putative secreted salivary protein [Ixodes scapularis]
MSLYSIALATFLVRTSQLCGFSSTVSLPDPPYEDDPKNFEHQHATGLLCSGYTYYMWNHTYTPQPPSECVSVKVTSGLCNGTYQVLLSHRFTGSEEIYSLNVTVHPLTSGSHTEDNALFFTFPSMEPDVVAEARTATEGVGSPGSAGIRLQDEKSGPQPPLYKFLYINSNKTCAVLRVTYEQDGTGCELFSVIERGAPLPVPQECMNVYIQNCPNTTSEVWKDGCKEGDQ